ncbi:hypothetical protein HMN09_00953600 [Mycena chlorophos]|uniref:Uncharacterized protein n=1 Tax=Mycena chlorophos TaxID=658473 RepID=A0A8H6SJV3_MYCCL|nr:hypothetical protein HMN09_00953600 [Mycena chlorophos]
MSLTNPFRRALQLQLHPHPTSTPLARVARPLRPISLPQQVPRRTYFLYPTQTRPQTLSGWVWYRRDGTPRSKLKGLVFGSLLLGGLYATWSTLLVVEALDYEHYLLSTLVYIQRVDYEFNSVSLSDVNSTLTYFEELVGYFVQPDGDVSSEMLRAFFADLAMLAESPEQRERIHGIITAGASGVHDLLLARKGAHAVDTAVLAIDTLDSAMLLLIALVDEAGSDGTDQMIRIRLKNQVNPKDSSILG